MQHAVTIAGQFVRCAGGERAAVVWKPPHGVTARFAVVHVPAAFEEMNKSRRSVALQARAFAAAGGIVVAYDPFGTGDSAGDHADATWSRWRDDAHCVFEWMRRESGVPCMLWGTRLGGLLAADLATRETPSPAALLLWQPVVSGRSYFNQFLRLAVARDLNGADAQDAKALRAALEAGCTVEVAGYGVHPALVNAAGALSIETLPAPRCGVIWRESSPGSPAEPSPIASNTARRWTEAGARVDLDAVSGPSFWASVEIEEARALIDSTTRSVGCEIASLTASNP